MNKPKYCHAQRAQTLDRLARRPLSRMVALCIAAACGGNALMSTAAAQTAPPPITLPLPNYLPIQDLNSGTGAPDQSGGQGGAATATVDSLDSGYYTSQIIAYSIGGAGGTGTNGGDPTGNGGLGGNGANVNMTVMPSAGVNSKLAVTAAVDLNSSGGVGGTAGAMDSSSGNPGQPGQGGNAGNVAFNQNGTVISTNGWNGGTPGTTAILMQANGGDAGEPLLYDGAQGTTKVTGANGNYGGNAGQITYNLFQGNVASAGSAIVALSQGGTGGDGTGSDSYAYIGQGGNGGPGGTGNAIQMTIGQGTTTPNIIAAGAASAATGVVVPIDANGDTADAALMAAGIQAQSMGGAGGAGGTGDGAEGKAGKGGAGGNAGTVNIALNSANIFTTGFAAAGVLAQSVGGAGGGGSGAGGIFYKKGGNGAVGGDAGAVTVSLGDSSNTVWPSDLITTSGDDSMGVVAQSIGGGGGAGGAGSGGSFITGVASGGDGQSGGTGAVVSLNNGTLASGSNPAQAGFVIATQGQNSSALVAQSIGGGGGTGGTATAVDGGDVTYTVGGSGGSGGAAGTVGNTQVSVENLGIVSTTGEHAKGVVAQAVGGGGGDGGAAQSITAGAQLNVSVAVGGVGGTGGTAGDVYATNAGQIFTSGSDAWGMLAQSVAGGGGNGGASVSDAFEAAGPSPIPSVTINASIGGKGGDGSGSGNVYAYNSDALIMTAGPGAHGMLAQSISGGGGNGGDSSALTAGVSASKGTNLDITVAIGGNGGDSGSAGNVTADNSAGSMIWTTGEQSDGIFAQSVSGGGGSGGTSKLTNEYLGAGQKASLTISLGGLGGGGGTGGTVDVTNEGNILTLGDGSNGILAQSVGGGGGVGSGGSIKGSAAKASESMTVTGNNGEGGNGGTVNVTNSATVLTYGGDAAAIYAQSVGGGGGKLGTGTTAGLLTTDLPLSSYLSQSTQLAGHTGTYAGVVAFDGTGWQPSSIWQLGAWASEFLAYANANAPTTPDGSGGTAAVNLYLGGSASTTTNGGDGGNVTVNNNFTAQTNGPASPGVFAQSVGAGGGEIGEYVVDQVKTPAGKNAAALMVNFNGQAFSYGNGGTVTVNNTGNIATAGDASFGVLAQSIGGGGGESIITASQYNAGGSTPIQIALSQSTNNQGAGGAVNVSNTSGALNASIATTGNDAVGIVAQSFGGGGGDAIVMQTAANSSGNSMGVTNPLLDETGSLNQVAVGLFTDQTQNETGCYLFKGREPYNSCGTGGDVTVSTSANSSISTAGRNAHGVLAQSFGGGGGWIVGLSEGTTNPFSNPAMAGSAGNINLTLGGSISTSGDGAYGVLAQSVGGGGVLGGDLAASTSVTAFPHDDSKKPINRVGSGGSITIANSGNITTSGSNATGIFAQSVGGGGGLYAANSMGANGVTSTLWMGTSGGTGDAGAVSITNSGTIQVTGSGSSAIVVDTQGQSNSSQVSVTNTGNIFGTSSAPAIMLEGGNGNGDGSVFNSGTITAMNGTAVSANATSSSFAVINNNAGGTINGDIDAGSQGTFNNSGLWNTNTITTAGTVNNNGWLNIGGATTGSYSGVMATSEIYGNLNNAGTIASTVDFYPSSGPSGGQLIVSGTLNFQAGSRIYVTPVALVPNEPVEILLANFAGINTVPVTDPGNNFLFNYTLGFDDFGYMTVQANSGSHFEATAVANGAYGNPMAVAKNLDTTWDTVGSGMSLAQAQTFASLATIGNAQQYLAALTNLANEGGQAATVAHVVASDAFVERMNSCPRFEDGAQDTREHDCVWGRVIGNNGDRDATNDSVGYHQSGSVFQLGGQKEVATDWFVGGSVSADNSNLDTRTVSDSVNGHGWTAGAVVKHQMGDWLVSGVLEGGSMSYDASRQVQLPGMGGTARSEFDVSHWGLHSRISKQFPMDGWYLKPYIDLHATHINADGYTEQGAGALDLKVLPSSTNVFGASPMIEAGSNFVFNNGMSLQLYGGIGGTFYNQGALGADMQFADSLPGSGTFHISSDLPSDRFKTTAGLDLKASDHWDVRLEYSGEFADHFQSDTGSLKATYKF
ncbi:autotransporter outer membrane beta-barrel domain-containing protein [Dyella sp. C11]|uniref:autotransporter outer membrane beta-barrel domain-containing protein n=1 Tax=Dyella sp. C11 TaxID=2126991 RepID=UPI000D654902|nr:autotransporter outer membrane beta-barrel domain-containing protein [Dyella sp. C11]